MCQSSALPRAAFVSFEPALCRGFLEDPPAQNTVWSVRTIKFSGHPGRRSGQQTSRQGARARFDEIDRRRRIRHHCQAKRDSDTGERRCRTRLQTSAYMHTVPISFLAPQLASCDTHAQSLEFAHPTSEAGVGVHLSGAGTARGSARFLQDMFRS